MKSSDRIELPFKLHKRGKVRDVYDVDGQLLIVSSDRVSAFDFVLPSLIPGKGQVLNLLALFWFALTQKDIANHVISAEPEKIGKFKSFAPLIKKRAVLVKKVKPFPIEAVVRAYITGSAWKAYQKESEICGIRLPPHLKLAEKFPEPIFTPTSKAEIGHDENLTFRQLSDQLGSETAEEVRHLSLKLFGLAYDLAVQKGIIIADSKFEFGRDDNGAIVLIDEIFTPDSSRFWKQSAYTPGKEPPPYDKQLIRNYLLSSSWDRKSPPPPLPNDIVSQTSQTYKEIYHILTGETL